MADASIGQLVPRPAPLRNGHHQSATPQAGKVIRQDLPRDADPVGQSGGVTGGSTQRPSPASRGASHTVSPPPPQARSSVAPGSRSATTSASTGLSRAPQTWVAAGTRRRGRPRTAPACGHPLDRKSPRARPVPCIPLSIPRTTPRSAGPPSWWPLSGEQRTIVCSSGNIHPRRAFRLTPPFMNHPSRWAHAPTPAPFAARHHGTTRVDSRPTALPRGPRDGKSATRRIEAGRSVFVVVTLVGRMTTTIVYIVDVVTVRYRYMPAAFPVHMIVAVV